MIAKHSWRPVAPCGFVPSKPMGYWCIPCISLLAMCHWLPCWLPLHKWPQWAESHCQQPPHPQCQGCWHPPPETKWQWNSSNQEAMMPRPEEEEAASLDITLEEHPHQRQKEGRPLARLLKESHQEAFRKDSDLIQTTRGAYFNMHHIDFDHEGSQDLCHTFQEMATSAGLMDSEIHKVQEVWAGWKDLWACSPSSKRFP